MANNKAIEKENRAESRWPATGAIVVALALYALLPSSFPIAVRIGVVVVGLGLLIPSLAANPLVRGSHQRWARPLSLVVAGLLTAANELDLVLLMIRLLGPASKSEAPALLLASVQVWAVNIIAFAVIFWQLDRGGPVTRTQAQRSELPEADFRFPQDEDGDSIDEVAAGSSLKTGWTANFVDYLYFSVGNAMAFSPPDAVPLTNRMKIIVGIQALGAYALLVLVIARAVSLLS